jgi:hypothetical protein
MIWHLYIAWGGYRFGTEPALLGGPLNAVSCCGSSPPGAPRSVDARISLPPNAEAQTVPLHFWAGF